MLRDFTDRKGVEWLVWDVYPNYRSGTPRASDPDLFPAKALSEGWLCFESPTEKRRLTPIPHNWATLSSERLEQLCEDAGYVSPPPTPSRATDVSDARADR